MGPDPHLKRASQQSYLLNLIGLTILSFGLTLTLFGALYARDVQALIRVPELLWYALCGQPIPDGSTGPILFGVGFAGAMAGALLLLIRQRRKFKGAYLVE